MKRYKAWIEREREREKAFDVDGTQKAINGLINRTALCQTVKSITSLHFIALRMEGESLCEIV